MTQVFDPEDGHVERVTVIEAGPCFVTGIRRAERDGYDAVQLAFGEVTEKKLNRPQLGHLKKAGVGNLRHLREFRGDPGEAEVGAELKVDAVFEQGQSVKVSGVSKGKGFQGTIKRHNFHRGPVSHGSHNVRAPGSIGASADPARVFKGIRGPGQMGNKRVTQRGLEVVDVRADENLLLVRGSVPGPQGLRRRDPAKETTASHGRRPSTSAAAPAALDLDDAVFGERFHGPLVHEAVRAELAARRRGTASTKTRGEVAMTGAKAWRQKGTGRARVGALSAPQRTGGGVAFGPKPRAYTVKVNRKARRRALRAALSLHAERGSIAAVDPSSFDTPSTKSAAAALARLERRGRRARGAHRRRGELRQVVPQPRRAWRCCTPTTWAWPTWSAPAASWSPRPRSARLTEKAVAT